MNNDNIRSQLRQWYRNIPNLYHGVGTTYPISFDSAPWRAIWRYSGERTASNGYHRVQVTPICGVGTTNFNRG